jgi:hypothetical protein
VCSPGAEAEWQLIKGTHFLVYYKDSAEFAQRVSLAAEEDYGTITTDLSYAKRDNFWLWKDRVEIHIYSTRKDFVKETGSPAWAVGLASYKRKEIATYAGSEEFLKSVLLHEMTHLLFREFVGFEGEPPLWLNEGVAQWEEKGKRQGSLQLVKRLSDENKLIPLAELVLMDANKVSNGGKGTEFYAESVSLVEYLVHAQGTDKFRTFCGQIRDGKKLDDALRFTYPDSIRSISELEGGWKRHFADEGR